MPRAARSAEGATGIAQPVGIIGLGTIGGSLALALRERGIDVRGFAARHTDRSAAGRAGIFICESLDDLIDTSRTIVLAVPLDQLAPLTRDVRVRRSMASLICHTVGLQQPALLGLEPDAGRVPLGTHPLAGSHRSGFPSARGDLFTGATVSIDAHGAEDSRRLAHQLWSAVGATTIERDAEAHDALMSWVSHLPQLAATALASVLSQRRIAAADTGPGARDATRLAASSLEMWRPLLDHAPASTVEALTALEAELTRIREAIAAGDAAALASQWESARSWRLSLETSA